MVSCSGLTRNSAASARNRGQHITIYAPLRRSTIYANELQCCGPIVRVQSIQRKADKHRRLCRAFAQASPVQEADTASPKPASVYGNGVHEGASALESPFEPVTPGLDPEEGAITIHYGTVWQTPHLHGSLAGGQWQDHAMQQVGSGAGQWCMLRLEDMPSNEMCNGKPLLEFVVRGDDNSWDKPQSGGNYTIADAGAYQLQHGQLKQIKDSPCLVVSDLDDTMMGNDTASAQFKQWWEQDAVGRGSRLVYNTGRAMDSFKQLCQEKQHCMALPDALISSVGTKVFQRRVDGSWAEDLQWSACLDEGWDLNQAREAAYHAVAAVGREQMHFRPPDEQNDHKVTCGVHASVVDRVIEDIQNEVDQASMQARIIVCGKTEWRYVDIVSAKAGKQAALEYVRKQLGFQHEQTIACGDSGNDKDMLAGPNRAIVVGNAQPDMKAWIHEVEEKEDPQHRHKQRMIVADGHQAFGILEGLEYFGFR